MPPKPNLQLGERFFRGLIREPDGAGERTVVAKAAKALAERMATREAEKLNWDWIVQHCEVVHGEDQLDVSVIEQWSSIAGHEIFQ